MPERESGFFVQMAKWMMAKAIFRYVAKRLGEASTWRSLFRLLTAIGIGISPKHWEAIAAIGIAAAELTGVAFPDRIRRKRVLDEPGFEDDMSDYSPPSSSRGELRRPTGREDLDRWGAGN